jgi:hypothetical protein
VVRPRAARRARARAERERDDEAARSRARDASEGVLGSLRCFEDG